jgi:hypothetical protein
VFYKTQVEAKKLLMTCLGSPRMSLPPHSVSQARHKGYPRFKKKEIQLYLLIQGLSRSYCIRTYGMREIVRKISIFGKQNQPFPKV